MDETFDFVVVGSGGGSMCAGLVLRRAGKSVLILEKTDLLGGSTARAGGVMWIPDNRFMKDEGIDDSFDRAMTYLDATTGAEPDSDGPALGATRERRATYVREATKMVDFLVEQGIRLGRVPYWPDYYDDRAGGSEPGRTVVADLFDTNELGEWKPLLRESTMPFPAPIGQMMLLPLFRRSWPARRAMLRTGLRMVTGRLTGKDWATAGRALQGRMLQAAVRAGVEFRRNAAVQQLVVEDGAVTGVECVIDGRPRRIGARLGVLLNAGGFARNQDMKDRYIPHTRAEWSHTAPGDTGDMHRELMRIGAAMAQMDEMVGNQMTLPPGAGPQMIQPQMAKPHAIVVDQSGVRYQNEAGSYMAFCKGMLERHKTVPAVPSWMIVDSRYTADYMLADTMPGSRKPARWTGEGWLKSGATIAELAAACGIPGDALQATVDRFNGFARAGVDEDFGRGARAYDRFLGDHTWRPNASLGAIEQAPFLAVPVVPGDVGTFGGCVTDSHARVLREDGSVIPGLYATGTTTASVMGRAYPGAGCSIGPSFTWGYVAAKHAAGLNA
ncbi:MAG: FAD-dependent oxidoreductase [Sphingomonadales bacterium]|nr:FAD-dependent oxidoreductase [Sphingomonadales bacterium]